MATLDVAIRGGTVIDGSGSAPRRGDVGISAGRIAAIGEDVGNARDTVPANGALVIPGFIDAHTHTDVALADDRIGWAAIAQGITTQVVGHCGWSAFPCQPGNEAEISEFCRPLLGGEGVSAYHNATHYLNDVANDGLDGNVVTLVGHNLLRLAVPPLGRRAEPLPADGRDQISLLAKDALASGAAGCSTGLAYAPSAYADEAELLALARACAQQGGVYDVHMRNESDQLLANIDANIALGRQTGVSIQISHLKASGRQQWGTISEVLAHLDDAAAEGVDVAFDVYPFTDASTMLRTCLPPWALEGGTKAALRRLEDASARAAMVKDLHEGLPGWDHLVAAATWEGIRPVGLVDRQLAGLNGATMATIANRLHLTPAEALLEVLHRERGEPLALLSLMHEDDLAAALSHPLAMVASDAIPASTRGHRRLWATYPTLLTEHANDESTLIDLIRKSTNAPAARFGVPDRGVLRLGSVADVVVLDPDEFVPASRFPERGMDAAAARWVFVAGTPVVVDGAPTAARPGRALVSNRTGVRRPSILRRTS